MLHTNKLDEIDRFRALLGNYQMSSEHASTLESIQLVLLLGPTSGGRNTIINELIKTGRYHYIISDTTRKPRLNNGKIEQNGVEYWFKTEAEVLAELESGNYIEAELIHGQQVSGIHVRELEAANKEHTIAINEVDIDGIETIVRLKPDTIAIIVLPPGFEEWQRRLHSRGKPEPGEFKRRMQTALKVFTLASERPYFKFVINDNLAHATGLVESYVAGELDEQYQVQAKALSQELANKTQELLTTL